MDQTRLALSLRAICRAALLLAVAVLGAACESTVSVADRYVAPVSGEARAVRLLDSVFGLDGRYMALLDNRGEVVAEFGVLGGEVVDTRTVDAVGPSDNPIIVRASEPTVLLDLLWVGPAADSSEAVLLDVDGNRNTVRLPRWIKTTHAVRVGNDQIQFFGRGESQAALCQADVDLGDLWGQPIEASCGLAADPHWIMRAETGFALNGSDLLLRDSQGDVRSASLADIGQVAGDLELPFTLFSDQEVVPRGGDQGRVLLGADLFGSQALVLIGRCCEGGGGSDVLAIRDLDGEPQLESLDSLPFLTNVRTRLSLRRVEEGGPDSGLEDTERVIAVSGIEPEGSLVDYLFDAQLTGAHLARRQFRSSCNPQSVVESSYTGPALLACDTGYGVVGVEPLPAESLLRNASRTAAFRAERSGDVMQWLSPDARTVQVDLNTDAVATRPRVDALEHLDGGTRFGALSTILDSGWSLSSLDRTSGSLVTANGPGEQSVTFHGLRPAPRAYSSDRFVVGTTHEHRLAWVMELGSSVRVLPVAGSDDQGPVAAVCSDSSGVSVVEGSSSAEGPAVVRSVFADFESLMAGNVASLELPTGAQIVGCVRGGGGPQVLVEQDSSFLTASDSKTAIELEHPGSCYEVGSVDQSDDLLAVAFEGVCQGAEPLLLVSQLPLRDGSETMVPVGEVGTAVGLRLDRDHCGATVTGDRARMSLTFNGC